MDRPRRALHARVPDSATGTGSGAEAAAFAVGPSGHGVAANISRQLLTGSAPGGLPPRRLRAREGGPHSGPCVVRGAVELGATDGNVYPAKETVALCRCGASTKKPFCDGAHSKIGFQAAERAVPGSAEE